MIWRLAAPQSLHAIQFCQRKDKSLHHPVDQGKRGKRLGRKRQAVVSVARQ